MTLWTVPGTGYAQLIINAGDGPTMVINRDETIQLYVGDDNSVASKQGTGDIDIIDPLSYIVYDGIDPKYAIAATPGSNIQVDCVKGATNWAPSPAQAAFQISLLGLATSSNQVTSQNTLVSGIGLPINAAKEGGGMLAGVTAGALTAVPGKSIAQDMLHANSGTTTEIAALLATGSAAGSPGGIPLIGLSGLLGGAIATALSTSPTTLINAVGCGQISYEGILQVWASANTFVTITMNWSIGGSTIEEQVFTVVPGTSSSAPHSIAIAGPIRGTQLTVTAVTTVGTASISYDIWQQSRTYIVRDKWQTLLNGLNAQNPNAVVAGAFPASGILCTQPVAALAAATSIEYVLPIWTGKAIFSYIGFSAANIALVELIDAASGATLFGFEAPASSLQSWEQAMPNDQCYLLVRNTGSTGTISPTISGIMEQY